MKRFFCSVVIGVGLIALPALAQKMPADSDGDGKVSKQEHLEAAAKLAEKTGKPFNPAFAEKVFEKRDKNGDGFITSDEQSAPVAKPAQ